LTSSDKGKQQEDIIQNKEVFLYKLYNITSEHKQPRTSEPVFIQEVDNLEKVLKTLQLPAKTILFYSQPYYKTLWKISY